MTITMEDLPPLVSFDESDSELPVCDICNDPVPLSPAGRRMRRHRECRQTANGTGPAVAGRGWQKQLEKQMVDIGTGIGTMVSIVDQFDGTIIKAGTPALAASLIPAAESNKKVRQVIERAVTGGVWGAVAIAAAGIVVPILMHHGLIPGQLFKPAKPASPPPDPTMAGHI